MLVHSCLVEVWSHLLQVHMTSLRFSTTCGDPPKDMPGENHLPHLLVELTADELQDPLCLFKPFFIDRVLGDLVKQTNLYFAQLDAEREGGTQPFPRVDVNEVCAFLGLVVSDSLHPYPSITYKLVQ